MHFLPHGSKVRHAGANPVTAAVAARDAGRGHPGRPGLKAMFWTVTKAQRDWSLLFIGAGDEIRTHDPNLGKVVLYP
jgi:hypothetical protein